MLIIFLLSNQNSADTTNTTGIVYRVFGINSDSLLVFVIIRKCAHFIEYLILGILVYNMFKSFNISDIILCSILLCALYACSDEIHQLFIQGREGKITDCLIDLIGSSTGILLIKLKQKFNKRLSKKKKKCYINNRW